jgi:hypothetical protein
LLDRNKDVDARHKAGHDELQSEAGFCWLHFESDSEELAQASVSKDEATAGGLMVPSDAKHRPETAQERLLTMKV